MLLVVAYDISSDRRRIRLYKLLHAYGHPVQESVFECHVTERERVVLQRRVKRLITSRDTVRYYSLCATCATKIVDGDGTLRPPEPEVYVV